MKPILLDVPMPIFTPRLQIRPRQVGEGPIVAEAVRQSIDHLKPWMPFAQTIPTDSDMEEHCRKSLAQFILRENFTLSIYDRAGNTFIGSTGFHRANWDVPSVEIGYWVHQANVGKGFVSEAVNALSRYAFSVFKCKRVEIKCDSRNTKSLSVATRLGYSVEGILRNHDLAENDSLRDTIITARYNDEGLPALEVTW